MRHQPAQEGEGVTRRSFLAYSAASAIAFVSVVLGFLGLGVVLSPALKEKKEGQWVKLGPLSRFPQGQPEKVDFTLVVKDGYLETSAAKSVWVVAQPQGTFAVFNSRCTHLGCIVDWKEGGRGLAFYSPCHAGVFDMEGTVLGGPPPRPLDALQWKTEEGQLWCRYTDFVVGIPEKKPV